MKRFARTRVILATVMIIAAQGDTKKALGQDSLDSQSERKILAPILGNYPDASLPLSTNTTVTPDTAPANTTRINVSTSTNFKGKLEGYPATGVVRVTDAHPAGTYAVTVRAFDSTGASATRTFTLTVTTPTTCIPVNFATAVNYETGLNRTSVAVGDFNGDGKQDVAVTYYDFTPGAVSIFLGNGTGNFTFLNSFGTDDSPYSVAVADFNRDGKQDLAVANHGSSNVSILLGNGVGGFSAAANFPVANPPRSLVVGDFNGDGKQDLAVTNEGSGNHVAILLGDGNGSFSATSNLLLGNGGGAVALGDFNRDGKQDIAVTNSSSNTVSILLGDGTGHFNASTLPAGSNPGTVAVGEFNGDGKQDLAISNGLILLGDGNGGFNAGANFGNTSGPLAVGDFNGDGAQDIVVTRYFFNKVSVFLGDSAGNFGAATDFGTGPGPNAVAVGGFNGDGKQDLAVANLGDFFTGDPGNLSILIRDCALTPTSVASRKTHGSAGSFDINLPLTGSPGIECRTTGGTNDYTIIVAFSGNVSVNGSPQGEVTMGAGCVGSAGTCDANGTVTASGNVVTVPLTNVANAQTINVKLNGVNSAGNIVIPMSVLAGDVNGNHAVNASDVALAKSRIGQLIDVTNFRSDVNANNTINATDVSIVKSHVGSGLP